MLALATACSAYPAPSAEAQPQPQPQPQQPQQPAAPAPQHRLRHVPSWASVEGEAARGERTVDDEVGIGFDRRRMQSLRGGRPLAPGTNEILTANPSVAADHLNPQAYGKAALSQQDPDLDGETPGAPLDRGGKPVAYPGVVQPASLPDRFSKVTAQLGQASQIVHSQMQAAYGAAGAWPQWGGWGQWWPGVGFPMGFPAAAGSVRLLSNSSSADTTRTNLTSLERRAPPLEEEAAGPRSHGAARGARGALGGSSIALAQAGSAAPFAAPFAEGFGGVTAGQLEGTSASVDMATAAVMAGLRGAHKRLHHEKQLVGSTLRRAQKSLASNGFDHTNGATSSSPPPPPSRGCLPSPLSVCSPKSSRTGHAPPHPCPQ